MTAHQEALPFEWTAQYNLENFIVTGSNAAAFEAVRDPARWSAPVAFLLGGEASGKTHLTAIFRELHDAAPVADIESAIQEERKTLFIDDADTRFSGSPTEQEKLFHLVNHVAAKSGRLLLTSAKEPAEWVTVPDLLSRLQAAPKFFLDNPDDDMVRAAYQKLFMDRGVVLDEKTIKYLVLHTDRSLAKIRGLVHRLDQAALADGKRLTRPYIGKILTKILG